MFSFVISQSQLNLYSNKICSLCQIHFFLFYHRSNVYKATSTVKGYNLISIFDFRSHALVFPFLTIFLKTEADVFCEAYNQLIDRV